MILLGDEQIALNLNALRGYLSLAKSVPSDPEDPGSPLTAGGGDREMLERSYRSALGACKRFTRGRQLVPLAADHVVRRSVRGSVMRVPDAREISAVTIGGVSIDPATVELVPWPDEDSPAPWIRLPVTPAGAVVTVAGRFGFLHLPADLEDSIYVFAARRYRERDAQYADAVDIGDGQSAAYFRSMPANVRQTWEHYRLPKRSVVSVQVRRG